MRDPWAMPTAIELHTCGVRPFLRAFDPWAYASHPHLSPLSEREEAEPAIQSHACGHETQLLWFREFRFIHRNVEFDFRELADDGRAATIGE